jgi:hypothetical protein
MDAQVSKRSWLYRNPSLLMLQMGTLQVVIDVYHINICLAICLLDASPSRGALKEQGNPVASHILRGPDRRQMRRAVSRRGS